MTLKDDRIDEFVQLWERAFGERITRDQARTKAYQLLELYRAIAEDVTLKNSDVGPLPGEEGGSTASPRGGGSQEATAFLVVTTKARVGPHDTRGE